MKKTILLILCLVLICRMGICQTSGWQWARSSAGTNYQEGFAVATDSAGNIYSTGFFGGPTITFDTFTLHNNGQQNIFVTKYSSTGAVLWTQSATFTHNNLIQANGIATDAQGNIYVTGFYSGTSISFGDLAVPNTSPNAYNPFLVKYDSAGNVQWVNCGLGTPAQQNRGQAVATDKNGNIYITGWFSSDSIKFGNVTLHGYQQQQQIFTVKYNSAGNALWGQVADGQDNEVFGIATDANANVYITGLFLGPDIDFVGETLFNGTSSHANTDYFIAKYDSAGHFNWFKGEQGALQCSGHAVATDAANNVYVTGFMVGNSATFGGITLPNPFSNYNCFIVKYNATGTVLWAQNGLGNQQSYGYGVATDAGNNVYVAGGIIGDSIKFDTATVKVPANSPDPIFLFKFDSAGNVLCGTALASGGDDQFGLCVDLSGYAIVCSDFEANPFVVGPDTLLLTDTVVTDGSENIYVAKWLCPACTQGQLSYQLTQTSICPHDSTTISLSGCTSYTISPGSDVTWIDSSHAKLSADSTTVFTVSGYLPCGLFVQQMFTLPVFDPRAIRIVPNKTVLCPGDTAQMCVQPGFSYIWSTGATTTCITTDSAGTYTVTASCNNLCLIISTQNITAVSTQPFNVIVHGDTLSYDSAITYQWQLNGNNIPGANSSVYVAHTGGTYTLQITNTIGCTVTSNPVVILGINQLTGDGISVYPNPSTGTWELTVDDNLIGSALKVFNATGGQVYQSVIANQHLLIDLSNCASGVYELRITLHANTVVKKLVKL